MNIPFPTIAGFRRWKRARAASAARSKNPLREFVYLDEPAVNSLYASRFGPIPAEYTTAKGWSRQAEIGGSLQVSSPGGTAGLTPKVNSTRTQNEQILRKASAQATFKEWYEFEREAVLLTASEKKRVPRPQTLTALVSLAHKRKPSPFIIEQSRLERGALLELEVELRSARTFRFSSIAAELLDIRRELPQLTATTFDRIEQVESAANLLKRFLVGLIPLESRATAVSAFHYDGRSYLAHRKLIKNLPSTEQPDTYEVFLVGVTEQDFYWKDIRRLLFSRSTVRVLARVGQEGLREDWNEVKLLDVLAEIDPSVRGKIKDGLRLLDADRDDGQHSVVGSTPVLRQSSTSQILEQYGRLLLEPGQLDDSLALTISSRAREIADSEDFDTQAGQRSAFRAIESVVTESTGRRPDPSRGPDLRAEALLVADRQLNGPLKPEQQGTLATTKPVARYVETEIISISW